MQILILYFTGGQSGDGLAETVDRAFSAECLIRHLCYKFRRASAGLFVGFNFLEYFYLYLCKESLSYDLGGSVLEG